MIKGNRPAVNSVDYLESRIRSPLEGRSHQRSVGLTQVVGTHGTQIESVVDLARNGSFTGGDRNLQRTFHLTPNLLYTGWKKTNFSEDIAAIVDAIDVRNPLEISKKYAGAGSALDDRGEEDDATASPGVILAFSGKVLDLVRIVDINETKQEPEVVLREAPPLESVRAIYPVDEFAHDALIRAVEDLR